MGVIRLWKLGTQSLASSIRWTVQETQQFEDSTIHKKKLQRSMHPLAWQEEDLVVSLLLLQRVSFHTERPVMALLLLKIV